MLQKVLNKAGIFLYRNSPTILTVMGAVGVVATTVLAVRATPKAVKRLDHATYEKGEDLTKLEVIQTAGPVYISTVAMGAATIACMFGANALNKQKQATLTAAYALMDRSFKEYRAKLIELKGEDVDKEVRDAVVREHCDFHCINSDIADKKMRFYDEYSGRYVECYERDIIDAEYHINRNYVLEGYVTLNEFYDFLGLPHTEEGDKIGWSTSSGFYWIDFEHRPVKRKDGSIRHFVIFSLLPPDSESLEGWL